MLEALALAALLQGCPTLHDLDSTPRVLSAIPLAEAFTEVTPGQQLFQAWTAATGLELFVTDGTAAGTHVFADFIPGVVGSAPEVIWVAQGLAFCRVVDVDGTGSVWRSDGTASGTLRLTEFEPDPLANLPGAGLLVGGLHYFLAFDAQGVRRLMKTDGTFAGTNQVGNVVVGSNMFGETFLTSDATRVYFPGVDATVGLEVFASDGTVAGTAPIADLVPAGVEAEFSAGTPFPNGTGVLFYLTRPPVGLLSDLSVYATDGTTNGTVELAQVQGSIEFFGSTSTIKAPKYVLPTVGNDVLFIGSAPDQREALWKTDGTLAGTALLSTLGGQNERFFHLSDTAELNGERIFFGSGADDSTWRTDGTALGTQVIHRTSWSPTGDRPADLTRIGNQVFYHQPTVGPGGSFLTGRSLQSIDASFATHFLYATFQHGIKSTRFIDVGGKAVFAWAEDATGTEFWVSDGTVMGTGPLAEVNPGSDTGILDSQNAGAVAGGAVFAGYGNGVGHELYFTDGVNVTLIKDLADAPATLDSNPHDLIALFGDRIAYARNTQKDFYGVSSESAVFSFASGLGEVPLATEQDGIALAEQRDLTAVWDGSQAGVVFGAREKVGARADLWRATATSVVQLNGIFRLDTEPGAILAFQTGALYRGFSVSTGEELVFTDGTPSGTQLVLDINQKPDGASKTKDSTPMNFASLGTQVLFAAKDGINGYELWSTDATTAGTQLLLDINPSGSSYPNQLTRVGDRIVFRATQAGINGAYDLWVSDGTAAGTQLVYPFLDSVDPIDTKPMAVLHGEVYFVAEAPGTGAELWRSNLTPGGTHLVADLSAGPASSLITHVTANGERVFFVAEVSGAQTGRELFVTDGTAMGTSLVAELVAGPGDGNIRELFAAGRGVWLTADDLAPADGELYFSDGSTIMSMCDLTTASAPLELFDPNDPAVAEMASDPREFTFADGHLYFVAGSTQTLGRELFEIANPGAHVLNLGGTHDRLFIEADVPLLGTHVELRGAGATPGKVSVVALSAPLAGPLSFAPLSTSALWINTNQWQLLGVRATPDWTIAQTLPNQPSLDGLQVNVQAFAINPLTASGWELSNGLRLVLGN